MKKQAGFCVQVFPVDSTPISNGNIDNATVRLVSAFIEVTAPEDTSLGTVENIAINYMKDFCKVRATGVRAYGYSGA